MPVMHREGANVFVFGTTGELIKIFPLIKKFEEQSIPIELWCTSQQIEELPSALESLNILTSPEWISRGAKGKSLHTKVEVLIWMIKVSIAFARRGGRIRATRSKGFVCVHGDTMTTAFGAFFGRIFGGRVVHIEAGMRSGDWRNPFPEELSRRAVARLSDVNYAPGPTAMRNLEGSRGRNVDTEVNTICDALRIAIQGNEGQYPGVFGLVSVHRSELYEDSERLSSFLHAIARHGTTNKLFFIDHPVTAKRIQDLGLDEVFERTLVERIPKVEYFKFIQMLSRAQYVVTDSGGLQQECEITGHPCLVHRAVTESVDRARDNIVLSRLQIEVLEEFLANPSRHRASYDLNIPSATETIFIDLADNDFIAR